ncbi:unnamed protein product, partial [Urochloa humidicola]
FTSLFLLSQIASGLLDLQPRAPPSPFVPSSARCPLHLLDARRRLSLFSARATASPSSAPAAAASRRPRPSPPAPSSTSSARCPLPLLDARRCLSLSSASRSSGASAQLRGGDGARVQRPARVCKVSNLGPDLAAPQAWLGAS